MDLPISQKAIEQFGSYGNEDHSTGRDSGEFPHAFNLLHVNADQLPFVADSLGGEWISGKYNIGYWAWELQDFPDRWLSSFRYLDEVWPLSSFCQAAIGQKSPIPVICMTPAVEVKLLRRFTRQDFGLPLGKFLFVTIFDVLSVFERKNPLAVIAAFLRAFSSDSGCHLVLKVNHASKNPDRMRLLKELAAGHAITILDRTISREEVDGLIDVCDCLVSLHRSEGLGLTLAEAMSLGKPVIATAYSGNLDFTHADNSFLVGYRLRAVGRGCEPYDESCVWADPNLDEAVEHMRTVAWRQDTRNRTARNGQEYVQQFLSRKAVGARMAKRLAILRSAGSLRAAADARREMRDLKTTKVGPADGGHDKSYAAAGVSVQSDRERT